MIRRALLLALGFTGVVATQTLAHDHAVSRGRLIFAYADRPAIGVLDLDSGDVTHRFDVPNANPRLVLEREGRYVFVLTGDEQGTVRVLDSGLRFESHGDHTDTEKGDVKLLDFAVNGSRPSHVTSAAGWVAVFFDGQRGDPTAPASLVRARAVAIDVASLSRAKPVSFVLQTPGPQHGLAVPLGAHVFALSAPNPAYARFEAKASSLPVGMIIRGAATTRPIAAFDGSMKGSASCPQLHGHAAIGEAHVFGCGGDDGSGVFIVQRVGRAWKAFQRAYPDNRRVSTLRAHERARYAVGNFGAVGNYRALIRIHTQSAAPLREADIFSIPADQPVCQFATVGERVVNLTTDGKLRIYRVAPEWGEIASFDAVAPFDCAFDAKEPKPSLAVLGDRVFVSDPKERRIREFDPKTLKQGLDLPIDGAPGHLATAD
jgi:hypothetical protein